MRTLSEIYWDCRALAMYSGGICSWAATKRWATINGTDGLRLLFADTLIEDNDLYRFLIEGAANIYGISGDRIAPLAQAITDIPQVEDRKWAERIEKLGGVRHDARLVIPGLTWIADGRSPWGVFIDEKFIGNSKVDPCSKKLKRELMNRWRDEHLVNWRTELIFGLDWTERGRIYGDGKKKDGHRKRVMESGWRSVYPMDEKPYLTHDDYRRLLDLSYIKQPRLYDIGWNHNNCGGFCVKAGFAQFSHLLNALPERFIWHEEQEQAAQEAIGTISTVLKRPATRKRKAKNITMKEFRETIQNEPRLFDSHGWGCGGGCAIDDGEDDDTTAENA